MILIRIPQKAVFTLAGTCDIMNGKVIRPLKIALVARQCHIICVLIEKEVDAKSVLVIQKWT